MQSLSEIRFAKKQQNYLPTSQPTPTERYYFYGRAVRNSPPNALFGFTYDGKAPVKVHPEKLHFHCRDKVGQVNRWKFPDLLHADLLGSAQAYRALVPPVDLMSSERARTDISLLSPRNIYGSPKIHRRVQQLSSSAGIADAKHTLPDIQIDKSGKLISFLNGPPVPVQRDSTDVSHPMQYILGPSGVNGDYSNIVSEQRKHSGTKKKQDRHAAYFLQRAQQTHSSQSPPDIVVEALGCTWHLHQSVLHHSTMLKHQLDLALAEIAAINNETSKENNVQQNIPLMMKLVMPNDPILSQEGMSVALGNLYLADRGVTCPSKLLGSVLATSSLLEFGLLRDFCERCMVTTLSTSNVVLYLSVASRHKAPTLASAAFNWLALNFITKMSLDSHLRFIDTSLLEQLLKSDRLFVPTEFALFGALMSWCFAKLERQDHLPPPGAILAYFSSLPRETALLDRQEGHQFIGVFDSVRYHGITSPEEVYEVQQANILPTVKLVRLLSEQLTSFCEGGDMRSASDLQRHGVRRGFMLTERPKMPMTEPIALYGFHFTLIATPANIENGEISEDVTGEASPSSIAFYIQRRHPQDPTFGAERAEREVFSLRGERYVLYSINVFNINPDGSLRSSTTGPLRGKFLIRGTTSRIVRFVPTAYPVYVQFSIVLPSS